MAKITQEKAFCCRLRAHFSNKRVSHKKASTFLRLSPTLLNFNFFGQTLAKQINVGYNIKDFKNLRRRIEEVITSATRNRVVGQPARGFESHRLRQTESRLNPRLWYFCIKGVAGIIIDTEVYVPQWSDFYLTQKRDEHGFYTK